jgi:lipid A 3-O-deacylase
LPRWALLAGAWLGCASAHAGDLVAQPSWAGRFTIVGENDALAPSPTDSWYTHGTLLSYLSGPLAPGQFGRLFLPGSGDGPTQHRYEILLGQNIFTPENAKLSPPDPKDRPFAGWLYTGFGLYQETNRTTLDHFELQIGVIGPASLAQQVQDGFHHAFGQTGSAGWAFQLKNEPGVVLSYERKWRGDLVSAGGLGVDLIPELGASIGNVYTYGEAGVMLRIGHNMKADYGPLRIRPALSGSTWFDPAQLNGAFGWYWFMGTQVRAVARNIFLDGNSFTSSPSVDKRIFVADFSTGASIYSMDFAKLDLVLAWRTEEFVGQQRWSKYGGFNISFPLP